jgi:hypothetical protein
MATEPQDFTAQYAALGEAELLALARDYDSLTESAQTALRTEFLKRGMEPPLVEPEESDEPEQRKLVTLRRYRDLTEAIIARGVVESAGIEVYLQNENTVRLDWVISNGIGGILLQVEESDAPAALQLLEQPIPRSIAFDGTEDFEQPHCPKCGSIDVIYQAEHLKTAFTGAMLLAIPSPTGRTISICNACGARWEDTDDG